MLNGSVRLVCFVEKFGRSLRHAGAIDNVLFSAAIGRQRCAVKRAAEND